MAMLVDSLLSESVSKLCDVVIYVAKTTANFEPQLRQLKTTLDRITPLIDDTLKLNRQLGRTKQESDMFAAEIRDAEKLLLKCLKIKRNFFTKFTHSLKLNELNSKLLRFFQIEVQADLIRDIKEILVEVKEVNLKLSGMSLDVNDLKQTSSSGHMSMSWSSDSLGRETIVRGKFGWRSPMVPGGIVAFEEPLKKLKDKVLVDDDAIDCDDGFDDDKVVVVSASGGCGKTTLVTMLCNDPQVRAKFGESIFFVTVSETPNFMVIVNELFNPHSFGQEVPFQSDEDAKNKFGTFLLEKVSHPILLVLDDVWSESFINYFKFQIKGYKIVVTSRTVFPKYDNFEFEPLSDQDAKILFSRSAFTQGKKKHSSIIHDDTVNKMVKCCKKHPLTLSVVGSSLNGKDELVWKSMLDKLSQGQSVLDLNKDVLCRLERSFDALDEDFKQYFLDFGLFPEDQRIPASALLDIWVHLYNHDDEGMHTLTKIFALSYRNLVTFMSTSHGEDSSYIINYCEEQFVMQHDLLRELALHLNSKLPIAQRTRLIINARGEDLPASIQQVQEPMQARILSISTEVTFSSRWCNMKVPEVEVLVLNIMSKTYTLPHFLDEMQNLKILHVTNHGLHATKLEGFHLVGRLSNLTRIRLENVTLSSLNTSILQLANLQKITFVMCEIGSAFDDFGDNPLTVWPKLFEIEMDHCLDLACFLAILCGSVHLKKLSITNCPYMFELSEELGRLTDLEFLSLRSCIQLRKLPKSITRLQKLSVLDISYCLNLSELPKQIGKLGGLRTISMRGCKGVRELPESVEELSNVEVVCNEKTSYQWMEFPNVKKTVVEEEKTRQELLQLQLMQIQLINFQRKIQRILF